MLLNKELTSWILLKIKFSALKKTLIIQEWNDKPLTGWKKLQKLYLIKDYYKTIQRTLEIQQEDNEKVDEKLHWTPYQVSQEEYTCQISTQKDDPYDISTEKYKLKQ